MENNRAKKGHKLNVDTNFEMESDSDEQWTNINPVDSPMLHQTPKTAPKILSPVQLKNEIIINADMISSVDSTMLKQQINNIKLDSDDIPQVVKNKTYNKLISALYESAEFKEVSKVEPLVGPKTESNEKSLTEPKTKSLIEPTTEPKEEPKEKPKEDPL